MSRTKNTLNQSFPEDLPLGDDNGEINRKRRLAEAIELYQKTGNAQRLLDILSFSSSAELVKKDRKHVRKKATSDGLNHSSLENFHLKDRLLRRRRSTEGLKNGSSQKSSRIDKRKRTDNRNYEGSYRKRHHSEKPYRYSIPSFSEPPSTKERQTPGTSLSSKSVTIPTIADYDMSKDYIQQNGFLNGRNDQKTRTSTVKDENSGIRKVILDLNKIPRFIKKSGLVHIISVDQFGKSPWANHFVSDLVFPSEEVLNTGLEYMFPTF